MQLFSTLFAALAIAAVGVHASAVGGCENPTVKDSQMIGRVNYTTYACDTPFDVKHTPVRPRTSSEGSLTKRQFNACTTSTPECQSAVLCNSDYCSGSSSSAPLRSDCLAIGSEMEGNGNTGTFFVQPGYYVSLAYGTCQFNWGNLGSFKLEYSFFNWGNLGDIIYNNCVTVGHYGTGYCISSSGLYYAQVV